MALWCKHKIGDFFFDWNELLHINTNEMCSLEVINGEKKRIKWGFKLWIRQVVKNLRIQKMGIASLVPVAFKSSHHAQNRFHWEFAFSSALFELYWLCLWGLSMFYDWGRSWGVVGVRAGAQVALSSILLSLCHPASIFRWRRRAKQSGYFVRFPASHLRFRLW